MRKLLFLSLMLSVTCQMSAADIGAGVSVMDDATGFIAAYLPVIRDSLYIFAGIIATAGIILVSYQMQTAPEKTRPLILALCGSCAFVTISAVTLPMFFGYDEQGVFAYAGGASEGSGSSTGGSSGSDYIGQPINPAIPELDNPIWMSQEEFEYWEAEDMYVKGNGGCDPDPEMYSAITSYLDLEYGHVTIQQPTQMGGPFGPGESAWDGLLEFGFITKEQHDNYRF